MIEYWYMALNHQFGLKLQTTNVERTRQRLYAARKALADPDLDKLGIVHYPPNQLWIVHRDQKSDEAPTQAHPESVRG